MVPRQLLLDISTFFPHHMTQHELVGKTQTQQGHQAEGTERCAPRGGQKCLVLVKLTAAPGPRALGCPAICLLHLCP